MPQPKSVVSYPRHQVLQRESVSLTLMRRRLAMMNQMRRQDKQVWTLQIKARSFLMGLAAKKTRASLGNPVDIDDEGLLADIEVQPIDDIVPTREDKRRDINEFFKLPVSKVVDGKEKKYCSCKRCPYVSHSLMSSCRLLMHIFL